MNGIGVCEQHGAPQLAGIEFAQRAGLDWTYIPYKGGSDAVTAVVGGQAHVLFNGMLATWPSVTGGKLRALAISSAQRVPTAKYTPTVAEQGMPGFETGSYQGVIGAAGTPRDIVTRLNGALVKALNAADMKERFAKLGTEVRTGTPETGRLDADRAGALGEADQGLRDEVRLTMDLPQNTLKRALCAGPELRYELRRLREIADIARG